MVDKMNAAIAILGAGNMGTSILKGLIQHGYPVDRLWVTNLITEKLAEIQQQFSVHATPDNKIAVNAANVIILATKPSNIEHLAKEISVLVKERQPLIISIAAGIRTEALQAWLDTDVPIIRAMPNTPAMVGAGATGLYANQHVSLEQRELAETIFNYLGVTVWLEGEQDLDTVTALSGSGPAYFFFMMEALEEAAQQLGLTKEVAHLLTLQTALGAARMGLEAGQSLADLRRQVTSPGGTTEQGVNVLEKQKVREILLETLQAAKLRAEQLAGA